MYAAYSPVSVISPPRTAPIPSAYHISPTTTMTQKYSDVDPPIAVTVLDPSDPSSGGGKAATDAGYAKAEAGMGKYGPDPGLPPIPAGSNRYYCSKCKQVGCTVYMHCSLSLRPWRGGG